VKPKSTLPSLGGEQAHQGQQMTIILLSRVVMGIVRQAWRPVCLSLGLEHSSSLSQSLPATYTHLYNVKSKPGRSGLVQSRTVRKCWH
jgi:hypothetical protein